MGVGKGVGLECTNSRIHVPMLAPQVCPALPDRQPDRKREKENASRRHLVGLNVVIVIVPHIEQGISQGIYDS